MIEQGTCAQCGNSETDCRELDHQWFPQREVCSATMSLAAAQRRYDKLHKDRPFHDGTFADWAESPSQSHPYHYLDGVRIWVSKHDLTPDDNFLDDPKRPEDGGEQRDGAS